ncbi:MAG: hypothetical protein MUF30_05765 [Burkholderiales bacterium]|nr:hypothetical protein [Burkholderiales bacterium]
MPRFPVPTRSPRGAVVAIVLVASLAGGCATTPRIEPLNLEQVVQLSKDGVPAKDIIQRLDDTRTVIPITGSQFARLRSDGVDDEVLDHIQRTYVRAVEFDSRVRTQQMYWGAGMGPWGPWGGFGPYWRPGFGPWPYW